MQITVQYLEGSSDWSDLHPSVAKEKLLRAGEILPIHRVLVGWNVPLPLLKACREAADSLGASLDLWHPIMTSDGSWKPEDSWRVLGPQGEPATAALGLDEFSFLCPNNPQARDAIEQSLKEAIARFPFDGVFLDRIRFPSPSSRPFEDIGCFCQHCKEQAHDKGLDLEGVQQALIRASSSVQGQLAWLATCLMTAEYVPTQELSSEQMLWRQFLDWREQCIHSIIQTLTKRCKQDGYVVGLDCFSPLLTRMVAQNLHSLVPLADWTKVMTYGHVYAPAGIPGELSDWTASIEEKGAPDTSALELASKVTNLSLPTSLSELRDTGISSSSLGEEVRRAKCIKPSTILAGVELVELEGVTRLSSEQIQQDIVSFAKAGCDGLSLSWDLWHIPDSFLRLVADTLRRLEPG